MRAFVDSNVLVRHLTGDPPDQAERASVFLRDADELILVDLVVAEVVYVLESVYEVERDRVAELVRSADSPMTSCSPLASASDTRF